MLIYHIYQINSSFCTLFFSRLEPTPCVNLYTTYSIIFFPILYDSFYISNNYDFQLSSVINLLPAWYVVENLLLMPSLCCCIMPVWLIRDCWVIFFYPLFQPSFIMFLFFFLYKDLLRNNHAFIFFIL